MANVQNNTGNELRLRDITAPHLNQSGYGAQMKRTFENIDDNFKILGNRDFIKGDTGYSLRSIAIPMIEKNEETGDEIFTKDGIEVLKAILSINDVNGEFLDELPSKSKADVIAALDDPDHPERVSVRSTKYHSLVEYITSECIINEIEVYDPANPSDSAIIGTTNDFVFRDARFVHTEDYQSTDYSDLYDYSCTVHLVLLRKEENGIDTYELVYQVLQNTPTLYYDGSIGAFCWMMFGNKTGIIAQGPQGTSGRNAAMHIVKGCWNVTIPIAENATAVRVTKALIDGIWENVDDPAIKETISSWVGEACIMLVDREGTGADDPHQQQEQPLQDPDVMYPLAFASEIRQYETGEIGVWCDRSNCIQTDTDDTIVRSSFFGISYDSGSLLHALFVPIKKGAGVDLDHTSVHAIWATPVGSQFESASYELHITPFKTYNDIQVLGEELSVNAPIPSNEDDWNDRLTKIDEHRYDPTEGAQNKLDAPRLQIDYPQVIISGPVSNGVPVAALGIGTSYLDPLVDLEATLNPLNTGTNEIYREVPRIKLGAGGVVQIGANKDNNANNNKGSLVVSNIYSSLRAISTSDDGGCPLSLIGTNGTINFGDSNKITENEFDMYGTVNISKDMNVSGNADIIGNVTVGKLATITIDPDTGAEKEIDNYNRIWLNSDNNHIQIYDDTASSLDLIRYTNATREDGYKVYDLASLSYDTYGMNITFSNPQSRNGKILTNAHSIRLGENTILSRDSIGGGTRKGIMGRVISLWGNTASETVSKLTYLPNRGNFNGQYGLNFEPTEDNEHEGEVHTFKCVKQGMPSEQLGAGSISPKTDQVKLKFEFSRKYCTGWSCRLEKAQRNITVQLLVYHGSDQNGNWEEIARGSDTRTVDINWQVFGSVQYSETPKATEHEITLNIDKNFKRSISQNNYIKFRYAIEITDTVIFANGAAISGSHYLWGKDGTLKLTSTSVKTGNKPEEIIIDNSYPEFLFSYTTQGNAGIIPNTVYQNGLILTGVNRHRNIGIYSLVSNDGDDDNDKCGIFASFENVKFDEETEPGNAICFISAADLWAKIYGDGSRPDSDTVLTGKVEKTIPSTGDLKPGKLYYLNALDDYFSFLGGIGGTDRFDYLYENLEDLTGLQQMNNQANTVQ